MKLRRALAAAAATAAIAPLALFAAPTAFAEGSPTPTAAESTPAGENTPTDPESTPADPATTPDDPATTPAGSSPSTSVSSSATASSSASTSPSGSATASSSPSASESGEPSEECPVDEDDEPIVDFSDVLHSSLTGLPESVVAGSGWTNFTFNVSNSGDDTIQNIVPFVSVEAASWGLEDYYDGLLTLQVKKGGSWVDVAEEPGEGGAFNTFSLDGGKSLSYDLRVKVDRKVPSAVGIAIGLAAYQDDKGCWISEDENYGFYYFEVLPAGSDAGKPNDAKPQTGGKKPISVSNVDVDGQLAETGSSSALPVLGLVGGFAVVAGTGVVFAVKRRKGATGAHA
ncbi:LPXTG cell wall anchor domain-containing protein [Streptomyces canus]|uniref:LPXTG cell wall anchor domain-containing protein n=1 Tax=Streptomyces canus TaxID=58343 RepID=UPI002255192F|nr:LPXTG cell wall anchor domain-containing protein [Streptomyces canus]MCX4857655.1 LPXTG cell wall anchor domain-containing protein [Streptomyces canus]WSW37008.1 LPXTG cell wall anchor domain-containing protein [Streptomyces canus]